MYDAPDADEIEDAIDAAKFIDSLDVDNVWSESGRISIELRDSVSGERYVADFSCSRVSRGGDQVVIMRRDDNEYVYKA